MTVASLHTLEAAGIRVTLDLSAGHIRSLVVHEGSRRLAPFHTAPWVEDASIANDDGLPVNLRRLSGDFFCAPFSTSDIEAAPPHGWPANSHWRLIGTEREPDGGVTGVYELERPVLGAVLEKRFTLRDGHPFLYQTHVFRGGVGAVPVANHAMAALPEGGRLSFSAKQRIETPSRPLEDDPAQGRSLLAYPAQTADPTRVPRADGSTANITRYPWADEHEDFVMLVEAPDSPLGWLAVSRPGSRDAMLSLKSPQDYPVTFLWFSNGGRFYPPWNGRHRGVLGVEEGRANSLYGHRASIEANALSARGIPTALTLDPGGAVAVRNVIGAVALAGSMIVDAAPQGNGLNLSFADGAMRTVPFDSRFLEG